MFHTNKLCTIIQTSPVAENLSLMKPADMTTEFCSFLPLNMICSVLLVIAISATITVLFLLLMTEI